MTTAKPIRKMIPTVLPKNFSTFHLHIGYVL